MPALSVVIPTLNRHQILRQTVALYLNGPAFGDFELIVVDQSDPADDQLLELAKRDERLRYFNVDFHGTTRARNFGVAHARTDLIVFSDDDVIPSDHLLTTYLQHFSTSNGYGAAGPVLAPGQRLRRIDEMSELERKLVVTEMRRARFDVDFRYSIVFGSGANSAFRRSAVIAVGGFDEEYSGNAWGEEYEFAYRFRQRFGSIDYLPEASVVHLVHATGGSRTLRNGKYVRNFCRNSIYTHLRTNAGFANTAKECWGLMRRFVISKNGLRNPRPHWMGMIALGCYDGLMASRLPRKLPLARTEPIAACDPCVERGAPLEEKLSETRL